MLAVVLGAAVEYEIQRAENRRFYRPPAETNPPQVGPTHSYRCKPCDVQWHGPEGSPCWCCGLVGIRR